jgi:hypothetical protein
MTKHDLIICKKGNVWCLWCVVRICISIVWPWHTEFSNKVIYMETALNELCTVMVSPAVFVLFCVVGEASKLTHRVADFGQ